VSKGEFLTSLYSLLRLTPPQGAETKSTVPVTRLEVAKEVIKALSYDDLLSFVDVEGLPFPEIRTLKPEDRKWVALAVSLNPPLFRGDARGNLNLTQPLTPQEWSYLKTTIQAYANGNIRFYREKYFHPHLTLAIKKWGFSSSLIPKEETPPREYLLQVGAYEERGRAERIKDWLTELGYPAKLYEENNLFKVRVGPYSQEEANTVLKRLEKQGFPSYILRQGGKNAVQDFTGPVFSLALLFDPIDAPFHLEVSLANDQILDREKTSAIARRHNALFALNASFFTQAGEPLGLLMVNGRVLSEPIDGWYNCGITAQNEIVFGEVKFKAEVRTEQGTTYPLRGINRMNAGNEIVLYDRFFGPKTPAQEGVECVVKNGVVIQVGQSQGNTPIPANGFIIHGAKEGAQWLLQNAIPGQRMRVKIGLYPRIETPQDLEKWQKAKYAVSGGPLLFWQGNPGPFGQFNKDVVSKRHPRTVIGETQDGKILFLVIDGRRAGHSMGLTIPELVEELKNYRIKNALNLDGGGSSTFYLEGTVLNWPSDFSGERKVSTALLLKKR